MKFLTIVNPGAKLKELEDALIGYWQQKGKDLDYDEIVGEGKADLVGENAMCVDGLRRSMNLFRERMFWVLERSASQPGDLVDLRDELARLVNEGMPVQIRYSRYYDVYVKRKFSAISRSVLLSKDWGLIPGFSTTNDYADCYTRFFLGQLGESRNVWSFPEGPNEFRGRVNRFVSSNQSWKDASFPFERSSTTCAMLNVKGVLDEDEIGKMISEVDGELYRGYRGFAERLMLTCSNGPHLGSFPERCKEIVLRRYEQSALFAEMMIINPVVENVHKLRAVKDEVFGTAFENLEIPLMTSSWKGTKFTAKRVFENGRHLIRMKLAGKEDVCRALLKEMEEELGVEIKIESCK